MVSTRLYSAVCAVQQAQHLFAMSGTKLVHSLVGLFKAVVGRRNDKSDKIGIVEALEKLC